MFKKPTIFENIKFLQRSDILFFQQNETGDNK